MADSTAFGFIDEIHVPQKNVLSECSMCNLDKTWDIVKECKFNNCPCKKEINGE
jgi:hypothetical protein